MIVPITVFLFDLMNSSSLLKYLSVSFKIINQLSILVGVSNSGCNEKR